MISIEQIFGKYGTKHKDVTPAVYAGARLFLPKVNSFIAYGMQKGQVFLKSPYTGNQIATDVGGFRPQDYKGGAPMSAHKQARAVDLYDGLTGELGKWILSDKEAQAYARELGLYFEHPSVTTIEKGHSCYWLHVTDRAPASGNLFFFP